MCAGAVSTAGGLVLLADDDGDLVGLGAKAGKSPRHFYMGRNLKASPMTLDAGGKQYITMTAGRNLFTLVWWSKMLHTVKQLACRATYGRTK